MKSWSAAPEIQGCPPFASRILSTKACGHPDRREEVGARQLGEVPDIDGIGLGAGLPDDLNLARIRDRDAVAGSLEPIVETLPVERGLHCGGDRRRGFAQNGAELIGVDEQSPSLADELTGVGERAQRDVTFVQVESGEGHRSLQREIS